MSTAEVLPVVRQQRDKMLTRVVIGALQQSLDALGVKDFSKAMQVSAAGLWQGISSQYHHAALAQRQRLNCADIEISGASRSLCQYSIGCNLSDISVQLTVLLLLMCASCMALCNSCWMSRRSLMHGRLELRCLLWTSTLCCV